MDSDRRFGSSGRLLVATFTLLAAAITAATPAHADRRIALVIGNSAYQNVNKLPNPAKDAAAMADMLNKAGFDVVNAKEDVTNADMRKMVRDFADQATNADVAVVYYAGHGIEIDGTNYILPIDARLLHDTDVDDEAVSLDRIVKILDPVKKLRLVILDACRDNPFQQSMKRSISSRGVTRGLAKVEPDNPNTLIAYAAKAGSTASDGDGNHSPFTTSLLKQLPVPGQDLRKSLGYVRDDVMKQTNNQQEPFVYGSLGGDDVVLVPGAARPAPVPAQITALDPNSQLRQDYELAAQINTKAGWDAFLKNYPKGFYADLARAAESKLSDSHQLAAVNPGQRNLSGAAPVPTGPSIGDFVGKSFRVPFVEVQEQESPDPGKVARAGREIAVYIKAADQTTSRFSPRPRNPNNMGRYSSAPLGGVDHGMQVTFADRQLLLVIQESDYRMKIAMTPAGSTCNATIGYELQNGKTVYAMRNNRTGEPVMMRALSADGVTCWITPIDEVGEPPVATAQPPAPAPPPPPAPDAKN